MPCQITDDANATHSG